MTSKLVVEDHRGKKIKSFLMGGSKFVCCGLWD